MLRLAELALFLAPFVFFIVWRVMATDGGPSMRVLVGAACLLAVLTGVVVWLSRENALPPGADYAPAQMRDGQIVSGHAVER
jgi:Family of unknown function (DUF6111)